MEKKQQMRISDVELEQLKSVFAGQDDLLLTVRNILLGLETSTEEKKQVKSIFSSPQLRELMRKQFLPELKANIPISQNIDLWMTVDLKDKDSVQIRQLVEAREKLIALLEKALSTLEDPNKNYDLLNLWKSDTWTGGKDTSLIARNTFISHIESQMQVIKILAGLKNETIEETKNRLLKDSTK